MRCGRSASTSSTFPTRRRASGRHRRGEEMNTRIDLYNHVMPPRYLEMLKQHSKDAGIVKRMFNLRMLRYIEARVALLRNTFAEVCQVLMLGLPPLERIGGAPLSH